MSAIPDQVTLRVTKIISSRGGGLIFSGLTASKEKVTVIAGYDLVAGATVEVGDIWFASGTPENHPKHGRQIRAVDLELELPTDDQVVGYLVNSPRFRNFGLGEKKVKDLWSAFKGGLINLLDSGDVAALSAVKGISEPLATEMVARWCGNAPEIKVRKWLRTHRIDLRLSRKIIKIWGDDVIEHLERDPYELGRFLSWKKTDALAAHLGIVSDDSRRLVGAVEASLFSRLDMADTLVHHEKLKGMIADRIGMEGEVTDRAIDEARVALVLVGDEHHGYQHRGIARLERKIKERFLNIIKGESGSTISLMARLITAKSINAGISSVEARISAERGRNSSLTPDQKKAVAMAVQAPLGIICGGAGTGKTTIIQAIHEILSKCSIPVYQMALAGRAAQRMRESTGHEACTIAKFCMEVKHGKRIVADDALFIIDESSMVDLSTMYRLLSYVPLGARIILVGDPHQLPPVSFGLVFDRMVAADIVPKVKLGAVHRQDESTGIPAVATDIRLHRVPSGIQRHSSVPGDIANLPGVHFIDCLSRPDAEGLAWTLYNKLGRDPDEIRVLGAVKAKSAGVNPINDLLRHKLNDSRCFYGTDKWLFAVGEEIIFLKNNDELGLNNGSLGTILDLKKTDAGWVMVSEWDDGEIRDIPETEFNKVAPAYALTVHKAQGSQFKKIICPIYKARNLDNALIYTALTRGQEQIVFLGDWKKFINAIESKSSSDNRQVGFNMMTDEGA